MVKNPPAIQETRVQSLGWQDPLEKGMATHSSILAWRIPWTEEPGRLQSMRSQRVGHEWATNTLLYIPFCTMMETNSGGLLSRRLISDLFLNRTRGYLEKAMAPHSSTLAWKIPWTEEPGRLQSMGSLRVRNNWVTSLSLFTFMHWRRKWQPTPVFLPGESQGQRGLVGCRLWGRTESDTTEAT